MLWVKNMAKKILTLCGSNSDIEKDNKRTDFTKAYQKAFRELNAEKPDKKAEAFLNICSQDRTPFLLPAIINKEKYDGIIYHGGYSLVLGAGIQSALENLVSEDVVVDYHDEFAGFMQDRQFSSRYIPGSYKKGLVSVSSSRYFGRDGKWIPTIGVPGKDTPSQGTTAMQSIVEGPPGSEPRPVVGLGRIDTAVRSMHRMLYAMDQGIDLVTVIYEKPDLTVVGESCKAEEAAFKISERLRGYGFRKTTIMSSKGMPESYSAQSSRELVMFVGENYDTGKGHVPLVNRLDKKVELMIHCPLKQDMSKRFADYLHNVLTPLDNTINVGVGNYDNAAILAAYLLNDANVTAGINQHKNQKTRKGVYETPSWLKDGKLTR